MQPTLRNMLKALLIALAIASPLSLIPAFMSIALDISIQETDSWILLKDAAFKFSVFFVILVPIIWLATFALLQRRQDSRSN